MADYSTLSSDDEPNQSLLSTPGFTSQPGDLATLSSLQNDQGAPSWDNQSLLGGNQSSAPNQSLASAPAPPPAQGSPPPTAAPPAFNPSQPWASSAPPAFNPSQPWATPPAAAAAFSPAAPWKSETPSAAPPPEQVPRGTTPAAPAPTGATFAPKPARSALSTPRATAGGVSGGGVSGGGAMAAWQKAEDAATRATEEAGAHAAEAQAGQAGLLATHGETKTKFSDQEKEDADRDYADAQAELDRVRQTKATAAAFKVDPNRYMANQNVFQKGMFMLSAALGSISQAYLHQSGPNQALEQMNKNIDRDIDAQKAQGDALRQQGVDADNLYGMHLKNLGDHKAAIHASRADAYDAEADQIEAAGALSKSTAIQDQTKIVAAGRRADAAKQAAAAQAAAASAAASRAAQAREEARKDRSEDREERKLDIEASKVKGGEGKAVVDDANDAQARAFPGALGETKLNPGRLLPNSDATKSVEDIDKFNAATAKKLLAQKLVTARNLKDASTNPIFAPYFLRPDMTEEEKKRVYANQRDISGPPIPGNTSGGAEEP